MSRSLQQALGVRGDAKHPLAHRFADDGKAAHFAFAVNDFLVGEHGAELLRTTKPGASASHKRDAVESLGGVSSAPRLCSRLETSMFQSAPALFVSGLNHELYKLQKNPLRPFEILWIGRVDLRGVQS